MGDFYLFSLSPLSQFAFEICSLNKVLFRGKSENYHNVSIFVILFGKIPRQNIGNLTSWYCLVKEYFIQKLESFPSNRFKVVTKVE